MQTDINMNANNNGYTIVSLVFFITYTLFQPPATVIIRRVGPRRFIAAITLLWGAVMIVSSKFYMTGPQLNCTQSFGFVPN